MDRETAVRIATVALHRAMADDLETAASYVQRLNGTDWLGVAIVAWVDTFIAHTHRGFEYGGPVAVAWLHLPTGQVETADEVTPAMRWAGRLIAARAADDEASFYALLRSLKEGSQLGH